MGRTAIADPRTFTNPTDPNGPVHVFDAAGWKGSGVVLLKQAQNDPNRQALYQKLRDEGLKLGMAEHQATRWARHKSSPFNAFKPQIALDAHGVRMVNALVPEDSWRQMTADIINVAQKRQSLLPRLAAAGLVDTIDNIGVMITTWHSATDQDAASLSMDGRGRVYDEQELTLKGAPVPIYHKDFEFGFRQIMTSGNAGADLSLNHGVMAGLKVAQREEEVAMNGASVKWGGFTLEGLTNATGRLTEATAQDWGTATNIELKLLAMTDLARTNNHTGPFELWVAVTQFNEMQKRLADGSDATGMSVALGIDGIEAVHPSNDLTDEVVMVEMSPLVVKVGIAEDIRTIQWETPGGFSTVMRVFSAKTLKIFDSTGIVHGTAI